MNNYPALRRDRITADLRLNVTNATNRLYVTSNIVGASRAAFVSLNLQFK